MLYETAEPNVILDDEPYECFTCKEIGDYYGISEMDKSYVNIGRTYSDTDKLKIYYFMKSENFEYKKGMSLADIYNQMLNKRKEK